MSRVWREHHEKLCEQFADLDWPGDADFYVHDDPDAHAPCYVVMPGGAMIALNHHAGEGVDLARANWIAKACNDYLLRLRREAGIASDFAAISDDAENV